jgi:hypothetical protein
VEEEGNTYKLLGSRNKIAHCGDLDIDERIIVKRVLEKVAKILTGLHRPRRAVSGWLS